MEPQSKLPSVLDNISNCSTSSIMAVDFIYQALSAIKSYDDFDKYKSQLFQAIFDIREAFKYIIDQSTNEIKEKPQMMEETKTNNYIGENESTNALGLRYNYAPYLNEEEKPNKAQLYFDYNQGNCYDLKQSNTVSNDKNQNSLKEQYCFNEHSNANQPYTNTINNTIANEEQYQQEEENNFNNMVAQMPLPQPQKIISNNNNMQEIQQQPQRELVIDNKIKKQKIARVADLISKINSDQELSDIITQLFGDGILDELMSSKVEDALIDNVEKSVMEIERLRQNDTENSTEEKPIQNQPQPLRAIIKNPPPQIQKPPTPLYHETPISEQTNKSVQNKSYADELLSSNGLLQKYPKTMQSVISRSGLNTSGYSQPQQQNILAGEYNYERSLRFGNKSVTRTRKNNSKTILHHPKTFVNYTSPHGHYFDSSLQNGGASKLPTYLNKGKNKRAFSPVREYIRSSNPYTGSLNMINNH